VPGGRRGARYASCYASRIESRRIGGTIYYRFQLVPLHTKDQTQRTVNASCTTYAATKASAEAAGYRQVNLQYHYDGTGRMRFQSVWVQLNH